MNERLDELSVNMGHLMNMIALAEQIVTFDCSRLNAAIIGKCGTHAKFAELMSLSNKEVLSKLCGSDPWGQDEIRKIVSIIDRSDEDIQTHFFSKINV